MLFLGTYNYHLTSFDQNQDPAGLEVELGGEGIKIMTHEKCRCTERNEILISLC